LAYIEVDTRAKLMDPCLAPSSWLECKHIIGQGTRVNDDTEFSSIIDFAGATNLFFDDAWDGLPEEQIDDIIAVVDDKGADRDKESKQLYGKFEETVTPNADEKKKEKVTIEKVREFLNFILGHYKRDSVKEMGSDTLSSLIKLSGLYREEFKEAFEGAANICKGYFGLQGKIYR